MKKYLITLAAMLLCMTSAVMAEKKPVIIIKNLPPIQPQSPQTGTSPLIRGEYDAEELTLYFEEFDGDADITIVDATTNQVVCIQNEAITSPALVNIDLSSLPSSTYYIFIELDNGDSYFATIQI